MELTNLETMNPSTANQEIIEEVIPQTCSSCGSGQGGASTQANIPMPLARNSSPEPRYIYACGNIKPMWATKGAEKEYLQAVSASSFDRKGKTENEILVKVLTDRQYKYLASLAKWVFYKGESEVYFVHPVYQDDLQELLQGSWNKDENTGMSDLIIGMQNGTETHNGLTAPSVFFHNIYWFTLPDLLGMIPRPEHQNIDVEFKATASDLFNKLIRNNLGGNDIDRLKTYIAFRSKETYWLVADCHKRGLKLDGIQVRPSRIPGPRKKLEFILSFIDIKNGLNKIEKYSCDFDVHEEYPFALSLYTAYFENI